MFDSTFYRNKKVLVTGHTGFKGTWMCELLVNAGASVTGYALEAPTEPNLFELITLKDRMNSVIGDIRNLKQLQQVFEETQPEIVIHLAAQPIVRESYKNPVYTYETNVMGTVNVLECVRNTPSVKSCLNVTTDKVYKNREWDWGYRENEELNGYDPYSNSKSCSELVTASYKSSFFDKNPKAAAVSTARAGNVIGGGDFAIDRIIPDCVRAAMEHKEIIVRNPYSTRPYQHVLEPVIAYLMIVQAQYEDKSKSGSFNVGPDDVDCWTTGKLVDLFCTTWKDIVGEEITWSNRYDGGPHEATFLKLDNTKIKKEIGWMPTWNVEEAMRRIVEWSKAYCENGDCRQCMDEQIQSYFLY